MEQCKLCLRPVARLEDSHFLSKGIYRILRDDSEKNPNPWVLTRRKAVQSSRQKKARLLCWGCEQRFSRSGEDWVLKHCLLKDGGFPLASFLASRTPDLSAPPNPTRIYYASGIPEINIPALAYFAASIFWRASIHPWNDEGSIPVGLGPFQEQFRQYLMGLQVFPKNCSLWVAVREGKEIGRLTYSPIGERRGSFHVYKFPMPGLAFTLVVSKNIPSNYREGVLFTVSEVPSSLRRLSKSYWRILQSRCVSESFRDFPPDAGCSSLAKTS
jgi:hypothetical protein